MGLSEMELGPMMCHFSLVTTALSSRTKWVQSHKWKYEGSVIEVASLLSGALEEVDWLRSKLEMLEKALRNQIPEKSGESVISPSEIQLDPDNLVIGTEEAVNAEKAQKDERWSATLPLVPPVNILPAISFRHPYKSWHHTRPQISSMIFPAMLVSPPSSRESRWPRGFFILKSVLSQASWE